MTAGRREDATAAAAQAGGEVDAAALAAQAEAMQSTIAGSAVAVTPANGSVESSAVTWPNE